MTLGKDYECLSEVVPSTGPSTYGLQQVQGSSVAPLALRPSLEQTTLLGGTWRSVWIATRDAASTSCLPIHLWPVTDAFAPQQLCLRGQGCARGARGVPPWKPHVLL